MNDQVQRIINLRAGGAVTRLHTLPTIHKQNVADHSWNVMVLCKELGNELCNKDLLLHALYHDVAEHWIGDIPAPVKWRSPKIDDAIDDIERKINDHLKIPNEDLTEEQLQIFKFCDMFEFMLYAKDEMMMGNMKVRSVFHNALRFLRNHELWVDHSETIYRMQDDWNVPTPIDRMIGVNNVGSK